MHASVMAAAAAERTRELRETARRDHDRAVVRAHARARRNSR
jgi:hypothetical protein